MVKIRLFDVDHKPLVGTTYTLKVGGRTYTGKTDRDGMVSEIVGGSPTSGTLTLGMWSFDLKIQPLPAIDAEQGYAARLNNLGYYADDAANALMRFQSANDLEASGKMDDKTKAKLAETHGH